MSTFGGKIEEIPDLSVDRFDGENVNSTIFFLSHCHSDHMIGLSSIYFQEKIKRENNFLYVSSISGAILRGFYPNISSQIKELPLEHVTSISLKDNCVSVTCIPAGHCPGSVMFLFESKNARVLYTGDYRVNPDDIKKFNCFYDTFNELKTIDKVYLDTTFFLKSYSVFPKREESLSELLSIILDWISKDPGNTIKLDARARYGYEYVFKEIYDRCNMPVHVEKDKFDFYTLIPEMDKCVTTDGASTQIHSCSFNTRDICDYAERNKVRFVRVSAFRWENEDFKHSLSQVDDRGMYFVCYSTHASYEEGVALLEFLKPKYVHVCVERPNDPVTNKIIKKLVQEKLNEWNPIIEQENKPKLFEVSEKTNRDLRNKCEMQSPPKKLIKRGPSILDSPPR